MSSHPSPTVVLVHGAFAESASWSGVIAAVEQRGLRAIALANPLRSVAFDAEALSDRLRALDGPIVLSPASASTSSSAPTSTRNAPR